MSKPVRGYGFECPGCGDVVHDSESQEHLNCVMPDMEEIWQCSVCATWYLNKEEAKECGECGSP